jgi:plastocyanin
MLRYAYLIFFVISLTIIGSSEQVLADHMPASVSVPQGTSVPGCETTNECFVPYEVTIDVGSAVTWSNDDSAAHTVTSGDGVSDGVFDSSLFMAGTTFSHTFEEEGMFHYFCVVHPWMTGSIVVEGSQSLPPVSIDAHTSQSFYDYGESVGVSGKIKNYDEKIHSNLAVTYRVLDPQGAQVTLGQTDPSSFGAFSFSFVARGNLFEQNGNYLIQIVFGSVQDEIPMYLTEGAPETALDNTPPKILQPQDIEVYAETHDGIMMINFDVLVIDDTDEIIRPSCKPSSGYLFGIGDTLVKCTAKDSAGNFAIPISFTITVNPPETSIPSWVKNVAGFWCENKIDDASFVEGIQYLIDNDIIVIPSTTQNDSGSQEVPQWVKNNACWWSAGSITDEDFALGIEYLVSQGIIRV